MGSKSNASTLGKSKSTSTSTVKDSAASKAPVPASDSQTMETATHDVWRSVKAASKGRNKSNSIIAVVPENQVKHMEEMIQKKRKHLTSNVLVASEKGLQHLIERIANWTAESSKGKAKNPHSAEFLNIIVSYAINGITYRIPATVKTVEVDACQGSPPAYKLNIGLKSTYCDVYTFNWLHQSNKLLNKRSLVHSPKCFFDCSQDVEQIRTVLSPPTDSSHVPTASELAGIRNMFVDFAKSSMEEESEKGGRARKVSSGVADLPVPQADGTETWFEKWKALLAVVIGAGSGAVGAFATGWVTAGGVYISGPYGLAISAGYFHGAVASGVALTGVGMGASVAAMIYFVPWRMLFKMLREKLASIWEYICQALNWVWEKMKELASTVIQEIQIVGSALLGQIVPIPMRAHYY